MIVSFKTREGQFITDTLYIIGIVEDPTYGAGIRLILSNGEWMGVLGELADIRKQAQFATDGLMRWQE